MIACPEPAAADIPSPERLATLRAAMECVLPSGDDGPSAVEAGADLYVAARLRQGLAPATRLILLEGLGLLDSLAWDLYERPYADCDTAIRDALLRQLAEIPHRLARRFIGALVALTLQGYLCDPRHGGNRGGLGWSHVGFDPDPWRQEGSS